MGEVPNAPVKRLLIEGSQGLRIGGSALDLAAGGIDNYIRRLGHAAGAIAREDGRKTILDADIKRAMDMLEQGPGGFS
ncbi:MAG: histone-like protein [Verrucomicrobiota bacterium]